MSTASSLLNKIIGKESLKYLCCVTNLHRLYRIICPSFKSKIIFKVSYLVVQFYCEIKTTH